MSSISPDDAARLTQFSLNHAEDAAFWIDSEAKFLYVNEAASKVLGYSGADLLGMSLFQIGSELTPNMWSQLWKEAKTSGSFAFEFTLQAHGGREIPVDITLHFQSVSGCDLLCGFFRDVKEKKHLQQLKNEFVSTVSHELRTPITIIRESVSQVLDGLWGKISTKQEQALNISLTAIDRLARIINDLLDASKMEAGKVVLRWEHFNLAELVQEVIAAFTSRAKDQGIELRAESPPRKVEVYADRDRIVQVLTNLVGNALKFSSKGKILITLQDNDTEVVCGVTDSGMGIALEDQERVFHKFVQVGQPAVTGEKGTGLGLAICKAIVELHGGRLQLISELNKGSTFSFHLPKKTSQSLFRQKMIQELSQIAPAGGALSIVHFILPETPGADRPLSPKPRAGVIPDLVETIRVNGIRKSDVLLNDSKNVWIGFPSVTKKEALRIVEKVMNAYQTHLNKKAIAKMMDVSYTLHSCPEDFKNEAEMDHCVFREGADHGK